MPRDDATPNGPRAWIREHKKPVGVVVAILTLILAALALARDYFDITSSGKPPDVESSASSPDPKGGSTANPASTQSGASTGGTVDSIQYLQDTDPINGYPRTGPNKISAVSYDRSISNEVGGCARNQTATFEYGTDKKWERLLATIGLDDKSPDSKAVVQFDIYAGDQPAYTALLTFGDSREVNIPIASALRISLKTTYVEGAQSRNICHVAGIAVWGNARLAK